MVVKTNNTNMINELKKENKEYLKAVEKFFDIAENVQDEDLKKRIIFQMLRCDDILSKMMEEYINKNK